jgi:pSer/pThr/pTyr-binding forkhead associated (FHA) protein
LLVPSGASAQARPDLPFDVVLALDNSGSMKKNDPDNLMRPAVLTFAARLPQDTRLGIVVFDTVSRLTLGLSPVSEAGFTEKTQHALEQVDYRGQWTDIPGAVERSLYELREHGRPASRRVVVLFTDGFVDLGDPARNRSRGDWLRSDLISEAKRESAMIFGIAFTEGADFELIQSVSQQTGGAHFRILSASEMAAVFGSVTDRIRQLRAEQAAPQPIPSPGRPMPASGYTDRGSSIPVKWLAVGLAALAIACGLWLWWARSTAPPVPATLQDCSERAKIYAVDKRTFRVGRVRHKGLRRNDLVVPGKHVSRTHAEIRFRNSDFYIKDDGSVQGTFVNGVKLKPGQVERLKNEDVIRFDRHEFLFGAVVGVAAGSASVVTEPASDREDQQPPRGTVPPAPQTASPMPVVVKPRVETVPPPGYAAGAAGALSGERSTPAAPESSKSTEMCLGCDKEVPSAQMRIWHGYRICGECETSALSLPSGQVDAFVKNLENKRLRRLQTVEKL